MFAQTQDLEFGQGQSRDVPDHELGPNINTSYPMDNMLNRSAQTGPPNVRKRRPVFPPAGRSVVLCTPQMAPRTSFLSRQPDVIASFSFGACTVQTCFQQSPDILRKSVHYDGFLTLYVGFFSV